MSYQPRRTRRRQQVEAKLAPDELLVSYSTFPRLGCYKFTVPEYEINDPEKDNPLTFSEYFPDEAINSHPRNLSLARNIRQRRGKKVIINVPAFIDSNTKRPFRDENLKCQESREAQIDDHIYMDALLGGVGN